MKKITHFFSKQDVELIRNGYYSAIYFLNSKLISQKKFPDKTVTMQIFQKHHSVLCGVSEVISLLQQTAGYRSESSRWINRYNTLQIESKTDGDLVQPYAPVMQITGKYHYFGHLESIILGILSRRTSIATNTRQAVTAANGKKILFFGDRYDYFLNQPGDGLSASCGGATTVCTSAQTKFISRPAIGTMPHALIAVHDGDTIAAASSFHDFFPQNKLVVLVDYDNDCIGTALAVAHKFKSLLYAVRVDTSENMQDLYFNNQPLKPKGVSVELVFELRTALNNAGFKKVKIIVSGGFTPTKIANFESKKAPVDFYAVGSSLLSINTHFTADIVQVDGFHQAKTGRRFVPMSGSYSVSE